MQVPQLLQQLRADNTSGATTLLEQAISIVEAFAMQPLPAQGSEFHDELTVLARDLIAAQPSMAVMITLVQHILETCSASSPLEAQEQLREAIETFRLQTKAYHEALCQHALDVIPPSANILTYSNSGTVVEALHVAHRHRRVQQVFLSESRPAYDGQIQARSLIESGIEIDYRIDIGLFECIPKTDIILMGADAVFPDGLINKLGTHALTQVAHLHQVPVYILCTSMKWLPQDAKALFRIEDHPSDEVWPEAPEKLRVFNRYFDMTPLDLVSGIISEKGVMTPHQLSQTLLQRRLAPELRLGSS